MPVIAVIGSGLAGLATAYSLAQNGLEVHVFESGDIIGMDAASVTILRDDDKIRIDTPMRAIHDNYYRRVLALYRSLGVALNSLHFSYSFSVIKPADEVIRANLLYNGASGFRIDPFSFPVLSVASIFAFIQYIWLILSLSIAYTHLTLVAHYFFYAGHLDKKSTHWVQTATLSSWTRKCRINRTMRDIVLVPLFASVGTCSRTDALDFPAVEVIEYLVKTFTGRHHLVKRGVRDVVTRLTAPIPPSNIHLASQVTSLRPSTSGSFTITTAKNETYDVDQVIFATQANHAAELLADYSRNIPASEKSQLQRDRVHALRQFRYTKAAVVNHIDTAVLPAHQRDCKDLNMVAVKPSGPQTGLLPPSYIMASHILPSGVVQTTNPTLPIDSSKVYSESWFERCIPSLLSRDALAEFEEGGSLQGPDIWFVGSWTARGIPLLEGCLASSEVVVRGICRQEGVECKLGWD